MYYETYPYFSFEEIMRIRIEEEIVEVRDDVIPISTYLHAASSFANTRGDSVIEIEGYDKCVVKNYIDYLEGRDFTMEDIDLDFFSLMGHENIWNYPTDYWKILLEEKRTLMTVSDDPFYGMEKIDEELQLSGNIPYNTVFLGRSTLCFLRRNVYPFSPVIYTELISLSEPISMTDITLGDRKKIWYGYTRDISITTQKPYIIAHSMVVDCEGIAVLYQGSKVSVYATKRAKRSLERNEIWLNEHTWIHILAKYTKKHFRIRLPLIEESDLDMISTIRKGTHIDPTGTCIVRSEVNDPGSALIAMSFFSIVMDEVHDMRYLTPDTLSDLLIASPLTRK